MSIFKDIRLNLYSVANLHHNDSTSGTDHLIDSSIPLNRQPTQRGGHSQTLYSYCSHN